MSEQISNNKRIAKNTIMLYIRMLLTMAVTLYSSRVILRSLGVEDFGIYNVVGGIVAMFGFLNASMVSSTQRFMSFFLGDEDHLEVTRVFSNSLLIHILIALIILVFAETIGLWFFYNKLNIPYERIDAAFWVFQLSIAVFILNVLRVPDNSVIIAYEKMSAYAYFSIIEVILKLVVVFLLPLFRYDKLIFYAILIFLVNLLVNLIYRLYVEHKFKTVSFIPKYEKGLFSDMTKFAVWSLWGNLSVSLSSYGLNILLNMFFGPVVNAARGIAYQVQAAITNFGYNFIIAVNPQIIKSYAQKEYDNMARLVFRSSRLAFYLLFLIALPIIYNRDYILSLWLGDYPEYTSALVLLILIDSLINIQTIPIQTAINATGRIKYYQIIVGCLLIINLPVSYFLLRSGANVYVPFITTIVFSIIAVLVRLFVFKHQTNISQKKFYLDVLPRILLVVMLACLITQKSGFVSAQNLYDLIVNTAFTLVVVMMLVYLVGLDREEKTWMKSKISSIFRKNDRSKA